MVLTLHESRTPGLSCQILWTGRTVLDQTWSFDQHDIAWRIYRNDAPGASILTPTSVFALEPHQVVVVPPHGVFRSLCQVDAVGHVWIAAECPGIPAEWVRRHAPAPCVVEAEPWWHAVLDSLPLRDDSSPGRRLQIQALASLAIAQALGQAVDDDGHGAQVLDITRLGPALTWMRQHNDRPLSQPALARRCGMSSSHFARIFVRAMGMTPIAWQRQERLRLAADLLLRSTYSLEEIAQRCGFANRYHFSRSFAAMYHVGPGAFRRQGVEQPGGRS
jgi:AraC-like DNA-binding protein